MKRLWILCVLACAACKSDTAGKAKPPATGSAVASGAPAAGSGSASMHDQLIADARKAMAEQRWADAVVSARSAQDLDPNDTDAETIAKRAMKEGHAETAYKELQQAAGHMDRASASAAFDKIPADSYYKPLATELMTKLDAK
jgi:hypothetical protein